MSGEEPISASKNVTVGNQKPNSLDQQEPAKPEFDKAAAAQQEAEKQQETEQGRGSEQVEKDGNRHDMHPPQEMREHADREAHQERLAQDQEKANQERQAKIDKELADEYNSRGDNDRGNSLDPEM